MDATISLALYTFIPIAAMTLMYRFLAGPAAERMDLRGLDVHKPVKVMVKETGGISIYAGIVSVLLISYIVDGYVHAPYLLLTSTALFLSGLVDDMLRLDALTKVALTGTASLALLLDKEIKYTLLLPFLGEARLTILYPLVIVVAVMVSANMFNMADTINGSMLIAAVFALTASLYGYAYLNGFKLTTTLAVMIGIGIVLVYALTRNIFPAAYFNGDSGSLVVGGVLAAIAIISKTEVVFLVATLPLVLNGFQIISSIKGLAEKASIPRPTRVGRDGCIFPILRGKGDEETPVTLVQLFVLRKCLREEEILAAYTLVMSISFAVAIATLALLK